MFLKKGIKYLFRPLLITVAFFLCYFVSLGQNDKIDSLQYVLTTAKEDTSKVNSLNALSSELCLKGDYNTALIHAENAKQLAAKLNYKKGIAHSYLRIGNVYYYQGNYSEALSGYSAMLKIAEEIEDNQRIADSYKRIGAVYSLQSNYSEALKNSLTALKLYEQVGDKQGAAYSYNNIGFIYYYLGNYPEALKKYFSALKIAEEIGDQPGMAGAHNNIGSIYYLQNNYPQALQNYSSALKINEKSGDKRGAVSSYNNIGNIYSDQGNYSEALKNHFDALKLAEELGDKPGIANSYIGIGVASRNQGNYSEALRNYFVAIKIAEEIGNKEIIAISYNNIGDIYTATGKGKEGKEWQEKAVRLSKKTRNMEVAKRSYLGLSRADSALAVSSHYPLQKRLDLAMNALENYKQYVVYKDSLINEESIKKLEKEKNQYEFDKKEVEAEADRQKKEVIAEAERRKQQIILWSVSGGLLLVVLFAGFVVRSLRITKKQKQIIEEQKFQIVESINYSKKIQESLLPSIESMQIAIPSLFLFYEPKAIVSGDFYYFKEFENFILVACVDCTGHGVPGGFMSTLGSLLLDKITTDEALSPSEILNKLSDEIIRILHQQDGGEIQDGMDLSVCLIDKKNKSIEFSGARNGIITVSNNIAKRYKVSSLPVGGNYMKKGAPIVRNFQTEGIAFNPGDWIYMYTDGYMEQRGGREGIPMNFTQYENHLISLSEKQSPEEKNKFLRSELENWRGLYERDDDILIIGFQVI